VGLRVGIATHDGDLLIARDREAMRRVQLPVLKVVDRNMFMLTW
jgi:hypothetical protein